MEKLYSCRKCVLCCILVFYVILSSEAAGTVKIGYDTDQYRLFDYKTDLTIVCNFTVDDQDVDNSVSWQKNGKALELTDNVKSTSSAGGVTLTIRRATEADAANYTCVVGKSLKAAVTTVMKPYVKLPPHSSVVEGEKLTITCVVYGVPVPNIYWIVGNHTYNKSEGRINLLKSKEKEVPNAMLQINTTVMEDRESYSCGASLPIGDLLISANETSTFLRVKDKMAALWPFLGICAEVLILCTVILIYEKKRNKTEMEESDTDGSPEQKHTPDHGKDSEVRHRK